MTILLAILVGIVFGRLSTVRRSRPVDCVDLTEERLAMLNDADRRNHE